jgi:hypothetical protein
LSKLLSNPSVLSAYLRAGAVEKSNNFPGSAGFAQAWEDASDAVAVGVRIHISNGVDGERNIEPEFVRLSCR